MILFLPIPTFNNKSFKVSVKSNLLKRVYSFLKGEQRTCDTSGVTGVHPGWQEVSQVTRLIDWPLSHEKKKILPIAEHHL